METPIGENPSKKNIKGCMDRVGGETDASNLLVLL